MGYQTQYNLEIVTDTNHVLGVDEEVATNRLIEFAETNEMWEVKEVLDGDNLLKWYDHEKDMRKLSAHFPGVLFKLHGKGEEDDDYWEAYALDGKWQKCQATVTVTYPEFDPAQLK